MSDDTRKRFESYLPKYGALWRSMVTSDVQISSVHQESSCLASATTCSPSSTSSSTIASTTDENFSHLLLSENNLEESREKVANKRSSSPEKEISTTARNNLTETGITEGENEYDETTVVADDCSACKIEDECLSPIINSVRKKKPNQLIILESSEDEMSSDLNDDDDEETTCSAESEYKCCDDDDGYNDDNDDDIDIDDDNYDENHNKVKSSKHNCDLDEGEISDESYNTPKIITKSSSAAKTSKSKSPLMSKATFKKNREKLGKEAFDEFNKKAFNGTLQSVDLSWSKNLRTTSGITRLKRFRRDNTREATIELSIKVIDDISRLRATLLHEMCHAAQWLIDGVSKPPHGKCFKKWANIAMKHVKDVKVTVYHDYVIAYKYAWACSNPKCNVIIQRHSRSIDLKRHCCGKCHTKLIEIDVPTAGGKNIDKENLKPKKKREPSKFNLFVKQNSQFARKRLEEINVKNGNNNKVSQPEVMKECSRLWNEKKNASANPIDVDNTLGDAVQCVNIN